MNISIEEAVMFTMYRNDARIVCAIDQKGIQQACSCQSNRLLEPACKVIK